MERVFGPQLLRHLVCRRKHSRRRVFTALVRNLVCVDINGCRFLATVGPWDTKEYSLGHSYPMQGTLGRKDRNQRTQDPFWAHSHHPLEREASGTGPRVFVPAILDRLCRLTSVQLGATGTSPGTQGLRGPNPGNHGKTLGTQGPLSYFWFT